MADKKISELPKINTISGSTVILPIVHDGTTQQMDVSAFSVYTSRESAKTGSANTFFGNQIISGNLSLSGNSVIAGNSTIAGNVEVGGMITAQQYNVTYVSSSVQFKSGSTYTYVGVSESVYAELCEAESFGKFLNANIKGTYDYLKS